MAIQSQAVRSPGGGALLPPCMYGIYTPLRVRAALLEMCIVNSTGTVGVGLARPFDKGIPSLPIPFQKDDPSDPASVVNGHITWSVPATLHPTIPAIYHRRGNYSNAGSGAIWTFPRGLVIPENGSLVIFNTGAASLVQDISATIDA